MAQRYPTAAECIAADPYASEDCYRIIFYLERSDGYMSMNENVYYIYLNKNSDIDAFAYPLGINSGLPGVGDRWEYMLKYDSTNNTYYYPSYECPPSLNQGVYFMNWGTYDEEFTAGPGHVSNIHWASVQDYTDYYYTPVICYSDLIVYDSYNSPVYVPETDKEYFFAKQEGFTMTFGATAVETSNVHQPQDGDQNKYYLTYPYDPVIRFTSPVDGTQYEWNANLFTKYAEWKPTYQVNYDAVDPGVYSTMQSRGEVSYYEKNTPATDYKCIQGCRCLDGSWALNNTDALTWEDMTSHPSEQFVSLGDLVNYGKTINPLFSGEDVFTEINMDFYTKLPGLLPVYAGTKSVDYSSLQGSGADPTTSDGTGTPGTSWNPMPSWDDDGNTNPNLNGTESGSDNLNTPVVGPYGKFHRTYLLNTAQVEALSDILTTTDDSKIDAIVDGLKMWGGNPIEAIVDLRMYPFNVATATGSTAVDTIYLGRQDTEVNAIKMTDAPICVLYLGGIKVPSYYNNFLDYEPYTTIRLAIPYIGTIDLPPSLFINHVVSVNLIIDFYTGACTAVIYRDKHIVMQQEGVIGVSIAVSGDNAASYSNGIISNIVGTIGSAAGAIANVVSPTGNKAQAASEGLSAIGGIKSTIDSFNDVNFQQAGATSPAVATWLPQDCRLIIARPQLVYTSQNAMRSYGTNIGYATNYTTIINSLAGPGIYYGVVSDHIGAYATEPTPTAREIDLIKQRLNDGFFVGVRPSS